MIFQYLYFTQILPTGIRIVIIKAVITTNRLIQQW